MTPRLALVDTTEQSALPRDEPSHFSFFNLAKQIVSMPTDELEAMLALDALMDARKMAVRMGGF